MKIPRQPPESRLHKWDADRFLSLIQKEDPEAMRTDRYLHWDKFRHKIHPEGMTAEEHWAVIKFRRDSNRQDIPLRDTRPARTILAPKGEPFSFSLTAGIFERLHSIDMKCGGTVAAPEPVTNPETRDRYYISSLVAEATTSSLLEGAAVTRSDAKSMLRSGRKPVGEGEKMILNNYQTMLKISARKEEEMTLDFIREVHAIITSGTLATSEKEGEFRGESDDVRVEDAVTGEVVHTPPPATELPERLQAFCDFANDTQTRGFLHPVLRSIMLHFWIAYDHPFVDGNGRTARALFYWSMLKHGFWLFEFISISEQILNAPTKYYRAFLYSETDDNDLNYFLYHQLDVIQEAIEELHAYIQRTTEQQQEMRQLLGGVTQYNNRQIALLRHALEHPQTGYTVTSHQRSHGITPQTARTDLESLRDAGLLDRSRPSKAFVYRPVAGLEEVLTSKVRSSPPIQLPTRAEP